MSFFSSENTSENAIQNAKQGQNRRHTSYHDQKDLSSLDSPVVFGYALVLSVGLRPSTDRANPTPARPNSPTNSNSDAQSNANHASQRDESNNKFNSQALLFT